MHSALARPGAICCSVRMRARAYERLCVRQTGGGRADGRAGGGVGGGAGGRAISAACVEYRQQRASDAAVAGPTGKDGDSERCGDPTAPDGDVPTVGIPAAWGHRPGGTPARRAGKS